ncbi:MULTISPECIES: HD domain-containing protein [unclassified Amycolatopsis]|uniref:HD domain-containing protein n=1 Tax=unclassified Amycolatopsis TaxID=2618356 RepID=UPI00287531C7|nr:MULTISPECIES: HD domain-containing protein [unclassified Amycolatopsis]MDS0140069.1 HD domain-containing protein [Amycolatopsis sp. 505]MDS0146912.1 HD domain-containing protein [Amycolatopsis sp. CM201R]
MELTLPGGPDCGHAIEVATAYSSPSLLNHSMRVYAWAVALGDVHHVEFDAELLFVAAMLHDAGLAAEFDSHTVPFEVAGGHVAWVFAAGAGWPPERRARLAEVIVRHMQAEVDPAEDPEGFLLSRAAAADIAGRDVADLPAGFRAEVLDRYPRLDLVAEFLRCFGDQAARKPESSAAAAMKNDLATRMARNPLERN